MRSMSRGVRGERGAALLLGLGMVLLMCIIGALVVDIPLGENAVRRVQRAVDAAALAGAQQLRYPTDWGLDVPWSDIPADEQLSGWRLAKRAVFATLRRDANSFPGSTPIAAYPRDPGGANDRWWDSNPGSYGFVHYEYNAGGVGEVRLVIERGLFTIVNPLPATGPVEFAFTSLEGEEKCFGSVSGPIPVLPYREGGVSYPACPDPTTLPVEHAAVYNVANAVRVTATIRRLPTFFARLQQIAVGNLPDISRTGIAAPDLPVPVR